jgi:predicted Zn finger-like uncharacterized protein
MSLITRCPQCATLFKVEPVELSVAQGWVRCGQCDHVFDGYVTVVSLPALGPILRPEPQFDALRIDLDDLLLREDADAVEPPRSVQSIQPTRPWLNKFYIILLVLGVCGQAISYGRHELAARMPSLGPVLNATCVAFQCTLDPLRRLEGMVIDGSSFAPADTGFVLNLTLRNSEDVPLAMTSLELTLTDAKDHAIIRRVLNPSEMGAPSIMESGKVWNGTLAIEPLYTTADIAGYRLYSFYP